MKHSASNTTTPRRAFVLAIAVCVLPAAVQGCNSPTAPASPPGGGQIVVLDFGQFQASVEPVLSRQGCDATGDCHGGGIRGTLQLSPPGAKDAQFDFDQVRLQVSVANRDLSPILTRPLALDAGGTPHPYKPFASTADSDYVAIRNWVSSGVVQ
jgi:hypothetical protein